MPSPPPGNVDGTWATTIGEAATQAMTHDNWSALIQEQTQDSQA